MQHSRQRNSSDHPKMKSKNEKPMAFKYLLWIFRIMMLFPKPFQNIDFFTVAKFFFCITVISSLSAYGFGGHLVQILRVGFTYRNELMNDINALMQCLLAVGYLSIVLVVGNKILHFIQRLKYNEPENTNDVIRRIEKISAAYYRTTFTLCMIYGLDNTFKDSNCALKNSLEDGSTLICGSQVPLLFPMHLGTFFQDFVKILNWFILLYYFPSALTVPAFGLGSMDMIVARIIHLKKMLKNVRFGRETNVNLVESQLRNCIIYYNEMKSLAEEMNSSVSLLFLPQYTVMSTILALLEYQMITDLNAATIIRFTGWASMEFVICMKGQNLLDESLDLAECVYNMNWYEMPSEVRSMFKIFHLAVQNPIRFRAKPFVALDSKFLMNVMKSSYSLMMFLRTWSDEI